MMVCPAVRRVGTPYLLLLVTGPITYYEPWTWFGGMSATTEVGRPVHGRQTVSI